jgi:iron uptake system EfeUOB component EfeO/EfeM
MRRHCRAVRFCILRWGADVPQVKVTVNDKQCEPMTLTVNSGKTQFIIQNHSQKALEWEILKGFWWWKSVKTSPLALARR